MCGSHRIARHTSQYTAQSFYQLRLINHDASMNSEVMK